MPLDRLQPGQEHDAADAMRIVISRARARTGQHPTMLWTSAIGWQSTGRLECLDEHGLPIHDQHSPWRPDPSDPLPILHPVDGNGSIRDALRHWSDGGVLDRPCLTYATALCSLNVIELLSRRCGRRRRNRQCIQTAQDVLMFNLQPPPEGLGFSIGEEIDIGEYMAVSAHLQSVTTCLTLRSRVVAGTGSKYNV